MLRRLGPIAILIILLSGCASIGPVTSPGTVIVTTAGQALTDGAKDVPPTLDLQLSASRVLSAATARATLDGHDLALTPDAGGLRASVPPMALGSVHRLLLHVDGRSDSSYGFHVVAPAGAMAGVHQEVGSGTVLDLAFELAPVRAAVDAGLPGGGARTWTDDRHLRVAYGSAPAAPLDLPDTVPTRRGSHLAGRLRLDLVAPPLGTVRRAVVPAAPALQGSPLVVAFTAPTAASRASLAAHLEQTSVVSPLGWQAAADGSLVGQPDPAAVSIAGADGKSAIWPLVQNQGFDGAATSRMLHDDSASGQLVGALADAARQQGFGGVHLDFESLQGGDRAALSTFIGRLADRLHRDHRKLAVAVVPRKPGHISVSAQAYDLRAITASADLVTVMAYDEHYAGSGPGPVAGADWVGQALDGTLAGIPTQHALLGMPLYARSWSDGDSIADSHDAAVQAALSRPDAAVDYDFDAATPVIRSSGGVTWFDDADSLARKLALGGAHHLAGVAVWRLGFEDPAFWSLLPARARQP